MMSAVCSYSLSEIERAFSGKVKHKDGNVWEIRKNPGHIREVSKHAVMTLRNSLFAVVCCSSLFAVVCLQ